MATKKRIIVAKLDAEEYVRACFDIAASRYGFFYEMEVIDRETENPFFMIVARFPDGNGDARRVTYGVTKRMLGERFQSGLSTLSVVLNWANGHRAAMG